MKLGEKRRKFTIHVAFLILEAERLGYGVALDYCKRCEDCPVGHPRSCHKVGLAVDLHLYHPDGSYIRDDIGHLQLHKFWEEKCAGSKMIPGDPNHYSYEHNGIT